MYSIFNINNVEEKKDVLESKSVGSLPILKSLFIVPNGAELSNIPEPWPH